MHTDGFICYKHTEREQSSITLTDH